MATVVKVENISKSFGDVDVLDGISFQVKPRETLCVLGGSGSGKSTLLKIIIGALKPTSGKILVDGQDISMVKDRDLDRLKLKFGVMFQSGALLNSMSVAENIALPLEHHTKLDAGTIATMVKIKLQQVDLLHAADRGPAQISGGMQKRAAVARALAMDPRMMFFDEPSSGLDPIATARIDQLINKLKTTMGMTNFVVTHVMESVRRIADRVIMLHSGKVILDGTLDDLLQSDNQNVQNFVRGDLESLAAQSESKKTYFSDLLM